MILSRNRTRKSEDPVARQGWRGFFRPVIRGIILLVGAGLLAGLGGCGGASPKPTPGAASLASSAPEDSLGLKEFLALEPSRRQARRAQSDTWLEISRNASQAQDKIRALATAAGLAPDDPDNWLLLAKVWRWTGNNLRTMTCLDNAAAAVRHLSDGDSDLVGRGGGYRKDAAMRTALLRAWLHYDRAEYHEGLGWAKAALKLETGSALANQIMGLLEGSLGRRSQAHEIADDIRRARGYHTDVAWILSTLDRSWGRNREAFNYFLSLRPIEDHVAECFRDMGLAAERVGEWSYARRWYRESRAHLPFADTSSLVEIIHDRLDPREPSSRQPFWLAFGRYFVTGSRSAYTAYALEQFDKTQTPESKDQWAGLLVNSAGICLRMKEDVPWALRARGIVFVRTGKEDRGLEDLRRAEARLRDLGIEDGRVEAEIGHLLLVQQKQSMAVTNLRRAVQLDSEYAAAWSDLGLALIMTGDQAGAETALSRAIQLDPTSVTAWYNRGLLNLHAGNLEQAAADLGRAAELAPDNQDVARLLQQVVRQKNDTKGP